MMFQNTRYNRQEAIPLLGKKGQDKLSASSIAVIGAGGVKSPILFYLVAAGVGKIRIIDFDSVEMSNLNRQILYSERDVGRNKAEAAAERLLGINSEITIEPVIDRVSFDNFAVFDEDYIDTWVITPRMREIWVNHDVR